MGSNRDGRLRGLASLPLSVTIIVIIVMGMVVVLRRRSWWIMINDHGDGSEHNVYDMDGDRMMIG